MEESCSGEQLNDERKPRKEEKRHNKKKACRHSLFPQLCLSPLSQLLRLLLLCLFYVVAAVVVIDQHVGARGQSYRRIKAVEHH